MSREWISRPAPWVARYMEEYDPRLLPEEFNTPKHLTSYREVESWGSDGSPLVFDADQGSLVLAESLPGFQKIERHREKEGVDWKIRANGTMPGLCGICVVRAMESESIELLPRGGGDSHPPFDGGQVGGILHDMASGEWSIAKIRTDRGDVLALAAVAFLNGTSVCAHHAMYGEDA